MSKRDAAKLHNRDEVEVRLEPGRWVHGYVLGTPRTVDGRVIIPVQTPEGGWQEVDHTDVR